MCIKRRRACFWAARVYEKELQYPPSLPPHTHWWNSHKCAGSINYACNTPSMLQGPSGVLNCHTHTFSTKPLQRCLTHSSLAPTHLPPPPISLPSYPHEIEAPHEVFLHDDQLVHGLAPHCILPLLLLGLDPPLPLLFDRLRHHFIGHLAHQLLVHQLLRLLRIRAERHLARRSVRHIGCGWSFVRCGACVSATSRTGQYMLAKLALQQALTAKKT